MLGTGLSARKTQTGNSNFDLSVSIGTQEESTVWQMLARGCLSLVTKKAKNLVFKVVINTRFGLPMFEREF